MKSAPLHGLDLASPITAVKDGHALRLDDWVCREDGVKTRPGYTVATSGSASVEALLSYPKQLFHATADTIKDEVGTTAIADLLSGDWMGAVVANAGGAHMVAVNGADLPRRYDGASWAVADITGVNGRLLTCITEHRGRLWMIEKNSLRVWYLATDAIEGPAKPVYLDGVCKLGGSGVAVASMGDTRIAIVTSEGELAIYDVADPDIAGKFALVGVFTVPKPVGKRCFAKLGTGAFGLLTVKGLLPVDVVAARDSGKPATSISRKVDPSIYGATSVIDSLSNEFLLIHAGATQWVLSSTGGWSRFTGFGTAKCWLEHDHELYVGTSTGKVIKIGGGLDDDAPIRSFAVESFSRFGTDAKKQFQRVRPLYTGAHPYVPRVEMLLDYGTPPTDFAAANVDDRYWQWSDVTWPRQPMPWMREVSAALQPWRSIAGRGVAGALMMSLQTRTQITWTGYDFMVQKGNYR